MSAPFWHDNLRSSCPFKALFNPKFAIPYYTTVAKAVTWWQQRLRRDSHGRDLQHIMQGIHLSMEISDTSDRMKCAAVCQGKFSMTRAWNLLWQQGAKLNWSKLIWFQHSVPRHSFISWLALQNRLTTLDKVMSWGSRQDPTCCFCKVADEIRDHLLFICCHTDSVWTWVLHTCDITRSVDHCFAELSWVLCHLKEKSVSVLLLKLAWSAYVLSCLKSKEWATGRAKLGFRRKTLEHY